MSVVSKGSNQIEFMFSFGQFIIVWNHVELAARDILTWLAGGNITAQILSLNTGNTTLTDTVRLAANWRPEGQEHLTHFAKMMDIIRAYRNYYVHSLMGVGSHAESGEPIGLVISLSAKGKFELHEKALKVIDLDDISDKMESARKYGIEILTIFKNHPDLGDRIRHFALLEKPPLPKTLTKRRSGQTETSLPLQL